MLAEYLGETRREMEMEALLEDMEHDLVDNSDNIDNANIDNVNIEKDTLGKMYT